MPAIGSLDVSGCSYSNKVVWKQKVGNTLTNDILVLAVCADKLSFADLSLQKEVVQVLDELLVLLKVLWGWCNFWQSWETKLVVG